MRLGVSRPERYAESLSECRYLSEAWGLADLLYKLFPEVFQSLTSLTNRKVGIAFAWGSSPVAAPNRLIEPQVAEACTLFCRRRGHRWPFHGLQLPGSVSDIVRGSARPLAAIPAPPRPFQAMAASAGSNKAQGVVDAGRS
jgi:hypothetical protein